MASGGEGSELSIVEISKRRLEEFLQGFESQLDIIRRQPKSVKQATCESGDFKFGLHIVVWFLSLNEDLIQNKNDSLKVLKQKLVDDDQETIALVEDEMRYLRKYQKQVIRMTDILNQVRDIGRGTCVDVAKQARKLDTEIITGISDDFKLVESLPNYLCSLVSVVSKLDKRNGVCPEWGKLEKKRRMMFKGLDDDTVSELEILWSLNFTSSTFLPEHAEYSCTFYEFHCRYLDEELRNLALYVKARCTDSGDSHMLACQLAANDVELCNIHLRKIDKLRPLDVFPGNFGLRMYRACMRTVSHHVAEKWMKLRFEDDPDKRELVDTLHGTITSLRKIKHVPAERIELNGEHEGVGAQTQYKLPEPKERVYEPPSEKPWWVEVFGNRIKGVFPQGPTPPSTGQTCSSSADTVVLSTERYDSMMRKRSDHDFHSHAGENNTILTDNENASQKFKHNDNIRDFDIYSINFAVPHLGVENSISLKWSDREGNEQERKTNIRKDVPYHCRVLSYDLLQDEWVITSDFCRVTGVLSVEEKGASCEPLIGDCGFFEGTDCNVFKVHRHPRDHCLREYLSEIRAQCTASYYVNKFSNLTGDRFGCLRMLHIDCLLLFADSNRETIIDIMTREKRVKIHDEYKSMIKFDKFTNNTSWKNRGLNMAVLEAFAHFSHHESDGVLMVADLQGWVLEPRGKVFYILTDPVIHCPKRTVRFGGTNREEEGIMLFFKKIHLECNEICRELHLNRPPEFDDS